MPTITSLQNELRQIRAELDDLNEERSAAEDAEMDRGCAIGYVLATLARLDAPVQFDAGTYADLFFYPRDQMEAVLDGESLTPLEFVQLVRKGQPLYDCSFSTSVEVDEEFEGPMPSL